MSGARLAVLSGVLLWAGATMVLSGLRWFRGASLVELLRPFAPGPAAPGRRPRSMGSLREVIGPLGRAAADRLARVFGVSEALAVRLQRLHSNLDPAAVRLRQLGWSVMALAGAALLVAAIQPGAAAGLLALLAAPLLAFLLVEQRLAARSAAWQRDVLAELPIVAEQLGMLLSAGYSLSGALARIADRGAGASGLDLQRVLTRVRHGLNEVDALREWAVLADLDGLRRLVSILALNREAGDLGRLVAEEARNLRREAQRRRIEEIERKAQLVWVPVTVATLVPGVIFLAVPFLEAMRLFAGN